MARRTASLKPLDELDEATRERGLRTMTHEVSFSVFADSLVGGVILTAFALHLGATSSGVGMLAAVILWNQLLQGPGALLIERLRQRKRIGGDWHARQQIAAAFAVRAAAYRQPCFYSNLGNHTSHAARRSE